MTVHNDIEKFIELSPVTYRFLKSINVVRDISGAGSTNYDIEIVLGKLLENGSVDYLKLFCINATEICIGDIEGMFGLFVDIEDIKDRQLEGSLFRVSENENSSFLFYCSEFYADIITSD